MNTTVDVRLKGVYPLDPDSYCRAERGWALACGPSPRTKDDRDLGHAHQLELHVLELPRLATACDRNDEPELARWCRFFSATTDAELDELAMENPTLKQAKEALEEEAR